MDHDSLRAIPFLQKLTDEELAAFSALVETRDYPRAAKVIEQGTVPTAFHMIRDGVVHVKRQANKRAMLLATLGSGSFFGEINLFDPGLATASVIVMKPSSIASISYDRFRAYMDAHPRAGYQIASALLSELAHRMRITSIRLADSIYRPLPTATQEATPPASPGAAPSSQPPPAGS
jgi:CRP-like cAMP-binding protein